ncbi:TPA: energy-coupling factor transporter transmembrane protein EcfT [Escherichia coli]|nr:energy-coupling factor transporter transmembrane protein EcfT [Escherichia coli]EEW1331288.1 energy-coupling factor transporter transmembrane protein EcfT [Escherichia coli]EEW2950272.1 energy-coupling factor transporter transmembrane protein EcfT [Escherichia coli]EEW9129952.1 energy-coupling factor transporter transmembrane protein EcfT [Escherichia coli]EEW9134769.1 energy-coupling factor transporter transmembrane protein EcfT [Escherichia coli]
MHPFTSLTLWALAACTTLILPTQTILPVYSAATFFCLIALKATRRRAKYVVWLMFSLGAGLWLVHGGWLTEWLSGTPRSPERWAHAITLWLRILAIVSTSQLWMQYVPVQRFIRALFASRLPLDEGWYQRLRAMPALIIPLTHNALNDLAVRGAALDMRAFRINNRRTTLWAPADSTLQRVARYTMILLMLAEFGAWIWLR